jgi:hypothetical protein
MDSQDFDFAAAMSAPAPAGQPQEIDFNSAVTPKKRGRPKKTQPAPTASGDINNIYIYKPNEIIDIIPLSDKDQKDLKGSNIKDQLTSQELTFLELLFNSPRKDWKSQISIDKAMLGAGYGGYSQDWRYKLARKIVRKYERGAAGASQVFQDIGFGQVKVAQGIADKAENAQSEAVSLNALALAARCQGMTEQEQGGSSTGIIININTGPTPAPGGLPGAPPVPGASLVIGSPAPGPPRKPLQITR